MSKKMTSVLIFILGICAGGLLVLGLLPAVCKVSSSNTQTTFVCNK